MRIISVPYLNYSDRNKVMKPAVAFTAHPDFHGYNSTASCFFRRGAVLLSCAKGYEDIENLFCKIFQTNLNTPKNMLIIGIGKSQEPLSYLASIKGIIKDSLLKNNIDLHTVDLQPKPKHIDLKNNAFCDLPEHKSFPKYAESSFVKDSTENWLEIKQEDSSNPIKNYMYIILSNRKLWNELVQKGYNLDSVYTMLNEKEKQSIMRWRVNDEIFSFLEETYNNPQKSKWDSLIQDTIIDYPDEKFDVISANNVLPYIMKENELAETIRHIKRVLKPNGYFITDPYKDMYENEKIYILDKMKKVDSGIYQKIS